jgi:hypothetical protein
MRRKRTIALAATLATMAMLVAGGAAQAAFPNFSDCPTSNPAVLGCIDIQSRTGSLEIKGFTVPLGESLEIRGGLDNSVRPAVFYPPTGTNGFFSRSIRVPGGILGIEFPIPGNTVLATAVLAGPASAIRMEIEFGLTVVSLPVKVRLDNPILGGNCYIGSNSNPARINLTTGTTRPPAPNRPISGRLGELSFNEEGAVILRDTVSVDNAFAVPGATGCGLLGIANPLVNLRLRLPSAAGNNTMIVHNDVALRER